MLKPQLWFPHTRPKFDSNQVSSLVFAFRRHLYPSRPSFIDYICIRMLGFLLRHFHPSQPPTYDQSFTNNARNYLQSHIHKHHSFLSFRLEGVDAVCGAGQAHCHTSGSDTFEYRCLWRGGEVGHTIKSYLLTHIRRLLIYRMDKPWNSTADTLSNAQN